METGLVLFLFDRSSYVTQAGFQLNYIAEITLEFVILLPLPSKYRK